MSWFEDWFDSPLYDALYAQRDSREAETTINLISQYLPRPAFTSLLDLGCGRGRHAIALAERGYEVTGIDLSPKSIETAKDAAEQQGLKNISLQIRDMREPLNHTFDAIVNLFTSFGYFESDDENRLVIGNMASMLKPGGRLIIDYLNVDKLKEELVPEEKGYLEDSQYIIRRYLENGTIVKEIAFRKEGNQRCAKFEERVKAYRREWFEHALEAHDLKVIDICGDYDGQPFNRSNSPRLIIFGEKSA